MRLPEAGDLSVPTDASHDFRAVFNEHAPRVWRALRYLGVAESDVADVSQEVFVVVHRKLPEFRGDAALSTWLYGICLRVAADHRRRAYVRREQAVAEPPDRAITPPQDGAMASRDARRQLLFALAQLDEAKRRVFVLYEIEELSMKEIAAILKCPVQTAYSRLHAARTTVRRLLEEPGDG